MSSLIDNPIAYAQFHLRGGWKNTLSVTGVYALLIVSAIFMTVRLNPGRTTATLNGWTVGLLVLQGAILLLYGASRVSAAVRRDVTQHMLESHQLMPVGGFTAVLGYMIGAGGQALVLAVVTAAIGAVVASGAGVEIGHFLAANVALLLFTAFVWVVSAFTAFLIKGGFGILVGISIGSLMSQGALIALFPALKVLAGPLFSGAIFSMRGATTSFIPWTFMVSTVTQAFVGFVCFVGAARKYRRGEDAAIGPLLGLALVAGWSAVSVVGISRWEEFRTSRYLERVQPGSQMVASMLATMLLTIVPLASAAWASAEHRRHRLEDDPRPMRRPMPILLAVLIGAALMLPLCWAAPEGATASRAVPVPTARRVLATAVVAASFLVGMSYLLRWVYLAVPRALLIGGLWLVVTWLGPLLVDYVIEAGEDPPPGIVHAAHVPTIAAMSPIGVLIQVWDSDKHQQGSWDSSLATGPVIDDVHDYRVGLVTQIGLNALPVVLYYRGSRKRLPGDPRGPTSNTAPAV